MISNASEFWHGSNCADLKISAILPGLHAGSRKQAVMRWPGKYLYRIRLRQGCKTIRLKDTGSWSPHRIRSAARRAPIAVYLNRYEGLPVEAIMAAAQNDNAPDHLFRKRVPGCEDSIIILDPDAIADIEKVT